MAKTRTILRDLGDGLILRRASLEDGEALADFLAIVDSRTGEPEEAIKNWTLDLMDGSHPNFDPRDFTLVVDTNTGDIVSTLNLIPQTWSYAGIEFGVGRIELVATQSDYRRRGLVRAQMEVVHEWSEQRGHKVQGITGIPWFYRQFGYDLALEQTPFFPPYIGGRAGYESNVPRLNEGETDPYRVRRARDEDVPFMSQVYNEAMKRYLVTCMRDEEMWRYEIHGRRPRGEHQQEVRLVETVSGEPVAVLVHAPALARQDLAVSFYELRPGISWLAVTPSVIRYLHRTGEEYAAQAKQRFGAFALCLGTEHPVYDAMRDRLPRSDRPWAWYIRVPDVPNFVRHIAPVLERRLARSSAASHTGDLKISFIADGLRLVFENGRVAEVERWIPTQADSRYVPITRDALFPELMFYQLLFGFRSLADLENMHLDCVISTHEARELLNILFPKQASSVWGLT